MCTLTSELEFWMFVRTSDRTRHREASVARQSDPNMNDLALHHRVDLADASSGSRFAQKGQCSACSYGGYLTGQLGVISSPGSGKR